MKNRNPKRKRQAEVSGKTRSGLDPLLREEMSVLDPELEEMVRLEEDRQNRKLILIPSESITPRSVRQAVGSVFVSLYAEGYPPERMIQEDENGLADHARHLAYYRRYADRRFYKGTEYVHFAEALAQRRCADCFANERKAADEIHVNVQPISGAAANIAVYHAFLKPGDTLLAMELTHGGHLSHGSELHLSGKTYRVVTYGVHPKTGRLDYNLVEALAKKHNPTVIIAGYTSYPWAPDWAAFREIADLCGARLMADVAHPAGLIAGGVYPSPVGYADVVTFTTHKTLFGPRGACILTFNEPDAARVDSAVFPGLQGGPHVANIAGMAVCFRNARTQKFAQLQRRVVENARHLGDALLEEGIPLAYGGTDTHLLLMDLNKLHSGGEAPLRGEPVSRILDLAGLVVNKNTLPGDPTTALASGIRIGTPWVTQRGLGREEMERIAGWLAKLVKAVVPFRYIGRSGELPRGKVPLKMLKGIQGDVSDLVSRFLPDPAGLPAHLDGRGIVTGAWDRNESTESSPEKKISSSADSPSEPDEKGLGFHVLSHFRFLRIQGRRATPLVEQAATRDAAGLEIGRFQQSFLLDGQGTLVDDVLILREEPTPEGEDRFLIAIHAESAEWVLSWLVGLSDGYLIFDTEDVYRKVEGPVSFHAAPDPIGASGALLTFHGHRESIRNLPRLGSPAEELPQGGFRRLRLKEGEGLLCRPDAESLFWIGSKKVAQTLTQAMEASGLKRRDRDSWEDLRKEKGLPDHRRLPSMESDEASGRPRGRDLFVNGHADRFVWDVPYFVGQNLLREFRPKEALPEFVWNQQDQDVPGKEQKVRTTPLYPSHKAGKARFIRFAGWQMPGWFTSVTEEHHAVRKAAGLFDTTHMGVLEFQGPHTEEFLDLVCSNYARWYPDGMSYYGYLLDIQGQVLDDILVYRRARDRFMMVANASNHAKVLAWLEAVNRGEAAIDRERRDLKRLRPVEIRNLSDPEMSGEDARVDLALQGPKSKEIILDLLEDTNTKSLLMKLKKGGLFETDIRGVPVLIARTGYTGEPVGYELFVHPARALQIWERLLETGGPLGLKAAGLAARDSLRIEAGLPLYGHELAGPEKIQPGEAGFGAYVKFHKPFFVGRSPALAAERDRTREVCRFRMKERGIRVPRPGDPVVNPKGRITGKVTSCATGSDGHLVGMAYMERGQAVPGSAAGIFVLPQRSVREKADKAELEVGDRVLLTEEAQILERFPTPEERAGWR